MIEETGKMNIFKTLHGIPSAIDSRYIAIEYNTVLNTTWKVES